VTPLQPSRHPENPEKAKNPHAERAGPGFPPLSPFPGPEVVPNADPSTRTARGVLVEGAVIASGFCGSTMTPAREGLAEVPGYRPGPSQAAAGAAPEAGDAVGGGCCTPGRALPPRRAPGLVRGRGAAGDHDSAGSHHARALGCPGRNL